MSSILLTLVQGIRKKWKYESGLEQEELNAH